MTRSLTRLGLDVLAKARLNLVRDSTAATEMVDSVKLVLVVVGGQ